MKVPVTATSCTTLKAAPIQTERSARPSLDTTQVLNQPVTLPCGAVLPNRLVKGAMSEFLADDHNHATARHQTLYRTFARNGPGLLLTGNVQVDRFHLEHGANVVIDGTQSEDALARLRAWSSAAKEFGNQVWMQLSHAGRQTQRSINPSPKAPSAVQVNLPGNRFGKPVALAAAEIDDLVERFAFAAEVARDTGFDGIELHAAHGYLFSAFLSPRTNLRDDAWGGELAGRAHFLLETVARIRAKVGADYPIGVKLNSADFQRGGFTFEDSQIVAGWLDAAGVDLIEISGGSYEQPKMVNISGLEPATEPEIAKSTREREAYFSKFAPEIRRHVKRARLMVTGGFRSAQGMASAIAEDGVDLIGLGRPLCLYPDAPGAILHGKLERFPSWERSLRLGPGILGPQSPITFIKAINGFGTGNWYNEQLLRLADGLPADPKMSLLGAFIRASRFERRAADAIARARQ